MPLQVSQSIFKGSFNFLAASSLDSFLHIWDTRKKRDIPSIQLKSSTGSSKVAWEKTCGNILASAHGNQLRVWDIRGRLDLPLNIYINRDSDLGPQCYGNTEFFNARSRRILSVDFSFNKKSLIVTGSADSVVRVFKANKNTNREGTADVMIQVRLF